jgi:hypothetical protein
MGAAQGLGEVEPCFMRRQPHIATGRLLLALSSPQDLMGVVGVIVLSEAPITSAGAARLPEGHAAGAEAEPTVREQFLPVPVAQGEAERWPDRVLNDLGRKPKWRQYDS